MSGGVLEKFTEMEILEISNVMEAQWPVVSRRAPKKVAGSAAPVGASSLMRGAMQARVCEDQVVAIFQGDVHDPQRVSEYAADVAMLLLDKESLRLPKPDYMEHQRDINANMRAILVDWLVEVHMKYKFRPETLFLTVNIIDRYLSVRSAPRNQLQLLGVVSMLIASKYEEIDPPRVNEFAHITDHTYSKREIINMECQVLAALEFQVTVPTPRDFLDRLQRINGCDAVHRSFVGYALELALLDVRLVRHPPSVLVSAALLMSNEFFGRRQAWPDVMQHVSRCSEASLRSCAADLKVLQEAASTASLQAVRRKYQLDLHHAVADLRPGGARA